MVHLASLDVPPILYQFAPISQAPFGVKGSRSLTDSFRQVTATFEVTVTFAALNPGFTGLRDTR
jgi:hypothetical protein